MKSKVEPDSIAALEFSKPCGTTVTKCEITATYAIWVDHHRIACDYSGFRCEMHRNLLEREIKWQVDAVNSGMKLSCGNCQKQMVGGTVSEHFRWVKL